MEAAVCTVPAGLCVAIDISRTVACRCLLVWDLLPIARGDRAQILLRPLSLRVSVSEDYHHDVFFCPIPIDPPRRRRALCYTHRFLVHRLVKIWMDEFLAACRLQGDDEVAFRVLPRHTRT